jgi:pyruvate/2-oxoglutarate dehydrogenase complex dihydrolipoamide dehydrogenase (E3) component
MDLGSSLFDDKTSEILELYIIRREVTELILIFSVAIVGEMTEKELRAVVFLHLTQFRKSYKKASSLH